MRYPSTIACWLLCTVSAMGVTVKQFEPPGPPPAHVGDPVDDLYLQGNYAQSQGNFDYAIECWTSVLKRNPKDATALFNRGNAYAMKKDVASAVADYTASIGINGKDRSVYEARARAYAEKAGEETMLRSAIADYDTALQMEMKEAKESAKEGDSMDPKAWLAERSKHAENDVQALACCQAIMKIDPKDASPWLLRGDVYDRMKMSEKAIADYTGAIRLDPKNFVSYNRRAGIYLRDYYKGKALDVQKGIDDLTMVLELAPSAGSYIYRGAVYEKNGESGKALADFTEAIRLNPSHEAYGARVRLLAAMREWKKVYADYTEMIRMEGEGGGHYYWRADASYHLQDWDKAIADLDKAVEYFGKKKDGMLGNALSMRAAAYYHKKNWKMALADYNRMIQGNPDEWEARDGAAWIYSTCPDEKFRDGGKAMKLAGELCKLSRWESEVDIDTLAVSCAGAGKWEDAVKYAQLALKTAAGPDRTPRDEALIQRVTAHLALFQDKKPCREEKELLRYE